MKKGSIYYKQVQLLVRVILLLGEQMNLDNMNIEKHRKAFDKLKAILFPADEDKLAGG